MVNSGVDVGNDAMTSYLQSARAMAGQDKEFNVNLAADSESESDTDGRGGVLVPNIVLEGEDSDDDMFASTHIAIRAGARTVTSADGTSTPKGTVRISYRAK